MLLWATFKGEYSIYFESCSLLKRIINPCSVPACSFGHRTQVMESPLRSTAYQCGQSQRYLVVQSIEWLITQNFNTTSYSYHSCGHWLTVTHSLSYSHTQTYSNTNNTCSYWHHYTSLSLI